MNTDTENNDNAGLQDAFGNKGTKMNSISFSHPYAESIIDRAKELMGESKTASALIHTQEVKKVPVHVLKGDGESGYNPQSNVIYVPISGKKDKLDAKTFILFVKAFRALDQEFAGLETPNTSMDVIKYAAMLHTKNLDCIIFACKVVEEMSSSKVFTNLLDALDSFGYIEVYRAYEKGATKQELLDIYSGR